MCCAKTYLILRYTAAESICQRYFLWEVWKTTEGLKHRERKKQKKKTKKQHILGTFHKAPVFPNTKVKLTQKFN